MDTGVLVKQRTKRDSSGNGCQNPVHFQKKSVHPSLSYFLPGVLHVFKTQPLLLQGLAGLLFFFLREMQAALRQPLSETAVQRGIEIRFRKISYIKTLAVLF